MTSPASLSAPRAVLFDLDGTLADTAPDLAAAVNWLRTERGLAPTPYSVLRPTASAGARGMIGAAFGLAPGDDGYEELRVQWFDRYQDHMAEASGLFEGVDALLQGIEDAGMAWGVVTNKPARFTDPLIPQIGLAHAGCIVSGDTMPFAKPHPAPLLEGARRLDIAPSACWYVGDDLRDIEAGRAAGMLTVACAWGYCGAIEPQTWGADYLCATPLDLLELLRSVALAPAVAQA
ncbi:MULTISPECIES: HAD family hydrolase [unclassified Massilia]|uniref:HAD family hydrolase n=1 Tax=unclassified Massilia TaxID=2609279 RepID=UPI001786ADF5|nr:MULTISPECIES: HAD-IA family hydrolase [unclassified Massilia]MBD8531936.1 HAD-IA family hydrolase [Massilia sp. CFBP 13647]MBD8675450.1 HAD-IA family hydrolase [Massilia sp. CFBP 13721]